MSLIVFAIFFFPVGFVRNEPSLSSTASKESRVIFVYPNGIHSERDLFYCPENSACNVIHKRFWLPPIVERICRCSQRHECPWTWSNSSDVYTMTLDNRSQIKFCSDLSELPKCGLKKPAIQVVTNSPMEDLNQTLTTKSRSSQKPERRTDQKNVTALCHCQDPHYWKLKPNSTKHDEEDEKTRETYFCSKLKKCSPLEFCGHVRTDTYSTFYRCSCPKGHLCITQDKSVFRAEELLYTGDGYKAFCLPVKH